PNARGGYIDLHNFRQRHWRPALVKAGIEPLRQPYDLRHTYATFALRAWGAQTRSSCKSAHPASRPS
ncbi:MAG TPA: hypothetical protein VIL77_15865, partial [Gaiellaceae bacterium]